MKLKSFRKLLDSQGLSSYVNYKQFLEDGESMHWNDAYRSWGSKDRVFVNHHPYLGGIVMMQQAFMSNYVSYTPSCLQDTQEYLSMVGEVNLKLR